MNKFTIIIPIYNESESIFKLIDELKLEFKKQLPKILIVDDGSSDNFYNKFQERKDKKILVIRHKKNFGKCKAMETGIKASKNNLICVMDGDGQNPPSQIKKLIKSWENIPTKKRNFALVCGNRINRQDTKIKKISSKVANKVRKFILVDDCNDTACAFKVFSRNDYLKISYFKNMHRFLPALFKMNEGIIVNVPVLDRPRFAGDSKFNFNNRFWIGILDLIKVWILIKKEK